MFLLLSGMSFKMLRRTCWEKMKTGTMILGRAIWEENVIVLFSDLERHWRA